MTLPSSELQRLVSEKIDLLPEVREPSKERGRDFRREEVRASWREVAAADARTEYAVARIVITCSSGTYMRSLAGEAARMLGTCALALSIKRTRIGKYLPLGKSCGIWLKQY